jgi:hypothetical protein
MLLDRGRHLEVQLASDDMVLSSTTAQGLAEGRNRILVGEEILQFANATPLGSGVWHLGGLLRGRGATERSAAQVHPAGATFALLDGTPVLLDTSNPTLEAAHDIAAIGLADDTPVITGIANAGLSRRPLAPVHPTFESLGDGTWRFSWTRRARGAWNWLDTGDVPLVEQDERYLVGVGDADIPSVSWTTGEPLLALASDAAALVRANHFGEQLWVRQVGTFAMSDPLLLHVID